AHDEDQQRQPDGDDEAGGVAHDHLGFATDQGRPGSYTGAVGPDDCGGGHDISSSSRPVSATNASSRVFTPARVIRPAGVSVATTRPPSSSTTRSQSRSTSSIAWLTSRIETPSSRS